ncbi:hypothetical protein AJ80_01155 [Polytolypa hystricis UAMH7299]|uniref:O-methyltransferase n=1 Tax=Polytolypa hystricis (strain UAMH7299) TaxID=1447883 RepID=A0A2B7Z243_POLH7|nr:hypothetical protein AJ80_01155 [Polytolypa hystricis UAMH7299]
MPSSVVAASPKVLNILDKLHAESSAQESSFSIFTWWIRKQLLSLFTKEIWSSRDDDYMRDKFIALEADKSEFLYLLARSTGATCIVEAGTSFGVSTIYLALAAGQNAAEKASSFAVSPEQAPKVIGTENEPSKAARAKEHWKQAGEEVEPYITLLEGDLRELLPKEVDKTDRIDLLLLDIWTPMALPALKIVQPKLRHGALIIADNTTFSRANYKEFLDYIHDPKHGFKTMTTPFRGGLEVAVYLPSENA